MLKEFAVATRVALPVNAPSLGHLDLLMPGIRQDTTFQPMAEWKVLGGGVAGCVAAMELAKQGHKVTLFEKEAQLGGFFKNTVIDGLVFDIGTILLYSNNPLFSTFAGLLRQRVPVHAGAESIRIAGRVTEGAYPVYRKTEIGKIRDAQSKVHEMGVSLIGRGASHDYSSSHDVAKRAVEWAKLQRPKVLLD